MRWWEVFESRLYDMTAVNPSAYALAALIVLADWAAAAWQSGRGRSAASGRLRSTTTADGTQARLVP
jgi:hypothetical protein